MAITLDWKAIRPLNGKRSAGFEELCAQLAAAELPAEATFIRKGAPDAGVECFATWPDGKEWAWQAKYFDTLGETQWKQVDESVTTALDKHPHLVRYYVCTPLDRPDARVKTKQSGQVKAQKSALDKWDDHVKSWTKLAKDKGMTVEFLYWGNTELLERLQRPEHVGRVRFWFDVQGFDPAWFTARLEYALQAAGPRYSPELHVDLSIAQAFDAFGRTNRFVSSMRAFSIAIQEAWSQLPDSADTDLQANLQRVEEALCQLFAALEIFSPPPDGQILWSGILTTVQDALDEVAQTEPLATGSREIRQGLRNLRQVLARVQAQLREAENFTNMPWGLLTGNQGVGKTHLLCDVTRRRLEEGRPTVLLMGQCLTSDNEPWSQLLHQLDLRDLSVEAFVGALEAAAQAANCRALVLVDALNEGRGRQLWPTHLAPFLASLQSSRWITVVVSVRIPYDEVVIPVHLRDTPLRLLHTGFQDSEYDAIKTFFDYFGLVLPSTPLLDPEFSNPLFLKTFCQGLAATGRRQLPEGFQGISKVFDWYLEHLEEALSARLDYPKRRALVKKALQSLVQAMIAAQQPWLPVDEAEAVVNALLPGRFYSSQSLYEALVTEGLLLENVTWPSGGQAQDVVMLAYERYTDHLLTKALLDRHLTSENAAQALRADGPILALLEAPWVGDAGFLEALAIQVPERTGQELVALAPHLAEYPNWHRAFVQSLIWRTKTALSNHTLELVRRGLRHEASQRYGTAQQLWDALITVASMPHNPLNAQFLDTLLRAECMPDRDAWWSLYLHHSWNEGVHGPVYRLVEWLIFWSPERELEPETVALSATTLTWLFSSSNRLLRDRATKALVNLLTGRLAAALSLLQAFVEVDDPYIQERLYAAVYGAMLRSQDTQGIGGIAQWVYQQMFAQGAPPAHLLWRDYARGMVERALSLGVADTLDPTVIRPPYPSRWPDIPSEADLAAYRPDWAQGDYDSGELAWARNMIGASVLHGDFALYVIGTNSHTINWLSLPLSAPPWQSIRQQQQALLATWTKAERRAWEAYDNAHAELRSVRFLSMMEGSFSADEETVTANAAWLAVFEAEVLGSDPEPLTSGPVDALAAGPVVTVDRAAHAESLATAQTQLELARHTLETTLSAAKRQALQALEATEAEKPPLFELAQIQRYILKRVFELGWTPERFAAFDRFSMRGHGREANKPERIGKKYQWIAFHEIMALIADHFQYREPFSEDWPPMVYEGPWQVHLRDLDPSHVPERKHLPPASQIPWWAPVPYTDWTPSETAWAQTTAPLPDPLAMLRVTDNQGIHWLNVHSYFNWRYPEGEEAPDELPKRMLWYHAFGYLVPARSAPTFVKWAAEQDFWGRWMPEAPESHTVFLGEHAWAPAAQTFYANVKHDRAFEPARGCPSGVRPAAVKHEDAASDFDCSFKEGERIGLLLPAPELLTGIGLMWSGQAATYLTPTGQVAVQVPPADIHGHHSLLIREDLLRPYLQEARLALCWALLGEKQLLGHDEFRSLPRLRLSGVYRLMPNGLQGQYRTWVD